MDKKMFEEMNEKFKGAIQSIRDCVNSEELNAQTVLMGARLMNASKNGKGRVSLEFDAPRIMVDVSGNEAALIIAMQQLIEHFGVEKTLGLIAANCFISPKTASIFHKDFKSAEEKEVFKRVMNMSEEEREKIKNEL